jgi:hypothetical protein
MKIAKWISMSLFVAMVGASAGCERREERPGTAPETERQPETAPPATGPGAEGEPQPQDRQPVAGEDEERRGEPRDEQPVAGREDQQGQVLLRDQEGRQLVLTDRAMIRQVEQRLQDAGFDPGTVDGVPDQRFHQALVQFQERHDLEATGQLDPQTAQALGIEWERLRTAAQPHGEAPGMDRPGEQPEHQREQQPESGQPGGY